MREWGERETGAPGFTEQEPACLGKLKAAAEVARTMELLLGVVKKAGQGMFNITQGI